MSHNNGDEWAMQAKEEACLKVDLAFFWKLYLISQSSYVRIKYMELLDNQLKKQTTLIKMLEKNKLSHAAHQGVLDK